jgi:hypothetical protein
MTTAIEHFQRFAEKRNEYFDFADEYGERGYSDPEKGIVLANWNTVPKGLASMLERDGYELEWSDEWQVIYSGGRAKAYRTEPDCWHWESSLVLIDGEYAAPDGAAEWIDLCKTSTHYEIQCVPSFIHQEDIEAEGWRAVQPELECGWHPGQTDNPAEVVRALLKKHNEVLLQRTERSQFYSKYLPYIPVEE